MVRSLRQLFAKPQVPYLGVDQDLARRMAAVLWAIGSLLTLALWPLSPPDEAIDGSGLAVGGVVVSIGLLIAYSIRAQPSRWSFRLLLAAAYVGLAAISVMQWLAGGNGAPYVTLLLIPVLFVSAIYPPRVVLVFLAAVGVSLALPLLYDGANAKRVAGAVAPFVLWIALSGATLLLMRAIRAQRMTLAEGHEEARVEARVDKLTAIGNRRAFEEALIEEMSRADRMGTQLSMAMGDIEDFKRINDEFGHLEGDECLRSVATAIAGELRAPDGVFRWGGDEFALLAPGTGKEGAEALTERLQAKVSAACRRPGGEAIWIDFGTAELRPDMTATELTEAADLALMAVRARTARARDEQSQA
jgi:diguanylate cyclase (GGDEF)-like protein